MNRRGDRTILLGRNDKMNRMIAALAFAVLTSAACSPMYLAARPPVDISHYRGDGTIERLPNPINPGFKVDFPQFMLTEACAATYRLDGLPKPRHHSPYEVGVVVDLTDDEAANWPEVPSWLRASSVGSVRVRVVSASGANLLETNASISEQVWRRPMDKPQIFALLRAAGQTADSTVRLPSDVEPGDVPSQIQLDYRPGSAAQSRHARVRLAAGGED